VLFRIGAYRFGTILVFGVFSGSLIRTDTVGEFASGVARSESGRDGFPGEWETRSSKQPVRTRQQYQNYRASTAKSVAKRQVVLAGYRLADLVKELAQSF
jgi:hypothetical protein